MEGGGDSGSSGDSASGDVSSPERLAVVALHKDGHSGGSGGIPDSSSR